MQGRGALELSVWELFKRLMAEIGEEDESVSPVGPATGAQVPPLSRSPRHTSLPGRRKRSQETREPQLCSGAPGLQQGYFWNCRFGVPALPGWFLSPVVDGSIPTQCW